MQEVIDRIAAEVQANLKLADEHLPTVLRYTRRAVNTVLARCNRQDIPPLLETTVQQIVEDMLRADKAVPLPDDKEVSSVSRGDTNIHYRAKDNALQEVASYLKDYDGQLRRFTKPNIPRSKS